MNSYSPPPVSPVFSYGGSDRPYRSESGRRGLLKKSVPYVLTFVLGAGVGASGSSNGAVSASQSESTPAPTVVYSPTPVPTVVYSPSPVPTVVYSPSPVPATEAPVSQPSPVPAAPETEQAPETSEEEAGGGTSSGTQEAPAQSESDSGSVYYPNCKAARDAGAAPIYRGDPGYRSKLDADGDGIACEWK